MPALLQGDPSPRTLELFAEARAIGGAYRFHQWAASQLPRNVLDAFGHRFALGVNHRIAREASILSAIGSSIASYVPRWRTSTRKLGLAAPPRCRTEVARAVGLSGVPVRDERRVGRLSDSSVS